MFNPLVEEVFTHTTVRTRDTVFPLFGDAGAKSATEAALQEFGESVRVRPVETKGASLAPRRPDVEPEQVEGNLAPGEEMQDDKSREQPDPEVLRRRAAKASAPDRTRPTTHDERRGARQCGATTEDHHGKTSASSRAARGTTERQRQ